MKLPPANAGSPSADDHGIDRCVAPQLLRPVDETHDIAVVKVTEAILRGWGFRRRKSPVPI
jgi:hypothetical protein